LDFVKILSPIVCAQKVIRNYLGRGFHRIAEEMLHHLSGLNPAAAATKQRKVISQKRPASLAAYP